MVLHGGTGRPKSRDFSLAPPLGVGFYLEQALKIAECAMAERIYLSDCLHTRLSQLRVTGYAQSLDINRLLKDIWLSEAGRPGQEAINLFLEFMSAWAVFSYYRMGYHAKLQPASGGDTAILASTSPLSYLGVARFTVWVDRELTWWEHLVGTRETRMLRRWRKHLWNQED